MSAPRKPPGERMTAAEYRALAEAPKGALLPGVSWGEPRKPKLALTAPTAGETKGQGGVHGYLTRMFWGNEDFYLRSVPTGIPVIGKTEEERGRLIRITEAWKKAGMREGTPDYEIIWRGRAHLIEFKDEGEFLSALSPEQVENLLDAMRAGIPCAVAHTDAWEVEELLLLWGMPLRSRLPPRAAPTGRGLRWPLEGERLRVELLKLQETRARNTARKLAGGGP